MKGRIFELERGILAMNKQMSLEKSKNRRLIRKYEAKCTSAKKDSKRNLQNLKNDIETKVSMQILKWQMDERQNLKIELQDFKKMCCEVSDKSFS